MNDGVLEKEEDVLIDMANNAGIKYGGRHKGTPNKATAGLREAFNVFEANCLAFGRLLYSVNEFLYSFITLTYLLPFSVAT